jgi:hemerythrin-like domain-containing protein
MAERALPLKDHLSADRITADLRKGNIAIAMHACQSRKHRNDVDLPGSEYRANLSAPLETYRGNVTAAFGFGEAMKAPNKNNIKSISTGELGVCSPVGLNEPELSMKTHPHRRNLFQAGTGLLLACTVRPVHADENSKSLDAEVSPPEDLMREHGILNRVLLIYEAALDRFARNDDFDVSAVTQAAQVIREFIEGYHERNEEQYLFPRFRRAGKLQDLVDTLYQQHQAGRRLTDTILSLVPESQRPGDGRTQLVTSLRAFVHMYRPHEAREDTELFPQIRGIVSPHEFDAMAEDFEREERRRFGQDGFEAMVARVAEIERTLHINDLRQYTPS